MQTLSRTSINTSLDSHRAYVHTRVTSPQRESSPKPKPKLKRTPSERARYKLKTKRILIDLARASGFEKEADKLTLCHRKLLVTTCGKHIEKIIPNYTCELRLCPDCARRRASKFMRKYLPAVKAFIQSTNTQPCILTLTQEKRSETLQTSAKRLIKAFEALRRSKIFKKYFKGGLSGTEWTSRDALYHTHMHALVFRVRQLTPEDLQELKDRWCEITGGAKNLRLDWINPNQPGGIDTAIKEVIKYAMKPADIENLTPQQFADFMAMKGQKLFGTFGEFYKFAQTYEPEPESLLPFVEHRAHRAGEPCSHDGCGDPLFDVPTYGKDLPDFLMRMELTPSRRE